MFFAHLVNLIRRFIDWFLGLFGIVSGPRIDKFDPTGGWPGTILTIEGDRFSENRDENAVLIGGAPALIIEASTKRLLVLAGKTTVTGAVTVQVGANKATGDPFTVLPEPAVEDPSKSGSPRFFSGPQHGTPQLGVKDQPVLVIPAFPTDHNPGGPAARTALRNDLVNRVNQAGTYWREASFHKTSWTFTTTDWVALPRDRRFYFWQIEDVEDARRNLLKETTRSCAIGGGEVLAGRNTGFGRIGHPNPLQWNYGDVASVGGNVASAIKLIGARAYVAASGGGLFIVDITRPKPPATLGSIAIPGGWGLDVDVAGNTAVLAAREGGLVVVNVANPAAPVIQGTFPIADHRWVCAARIMGNRVVASFGTHLRLLDISNPALPSLVFDVDLGAWITSIDIAGNLAAVATDGSGTHFVEVAPGVLTVHSSFQAALRVRSVCRAGNLAFLAANDAGLFIVDVSNPVAPVQRSKLSTSKPVFHVAVAGAEAIVSMGNSQIIGVDVSNPVALAIKYTELPGIFPQPNLQALRDALTVADDGLDIVKDRGRLMYDGATAALAAMGPGGTLAPYKGIILVVNGPKLRGESWKTDKYASGGSSLTLNDEKGNTYIAINAASGRIAHEIGHWFKMADIYEEWFANGTYLPGTAAPWCMSGDHDNRPLFSGHQITERMHFYDAPNVVSLTWNPTSVVGNTYEMVAHDHNEDAGGRVHVLKLVVSSGLMYFVEVRQIPTGLTFDQAIPLPAGAPGAVVVTKATEGTTISNTFERPIVLAEVLQPGGQFVDAARNLVVRVEDKIQDRPLAYRVRVEWNQPFDTNPNGKFDLTITPWSEETWETVDCWVDSPRNNFGGAVLYESHEPGDESKPVKSGDRPWVKRKNKIYARIRNTGPETAPEAYVSCYISSPPGIGDNGDWSLLPPTKKLTNIPGKGEVIVDFEWIPASDKHTCIKIAIMPQRDEIEPRNNLAQENVSTFDTASSSSHQPVILEAEVRSPFVVWRKVDLIVRGLPQGWHAVVDQAWVWVDGKGRRPMRVVFWTELGTLYGEHQQIPKDAFPRVEGWTDFDHRYLPIGGILAPLRAVKKVRMNWEANDAGGTIRVIGVLDPKLPNVIIAIEITDEKGNAHLFHVRTNATGQFELQTGKWPSGRYLAQLFVAGGADAAEVTSEAKVVIIV